MGRVKKYSREKDSKKRRAASMAARLGKKLESDMDGVEVKTQEKTQGALSIAKRRQIFKKSKDGRRDVKKRIMELKIQSKKLKKRDLNQRDTKKSIAHEIKQLKGQLNKNLKEEDWEDIPSDENDSD